MQVARPPISFQITLVRQRCPHVDEQKEPTNQLIDHVMVAFQNVEGLFGRGPCTSPYMGSNIEARVGWVIRVSFHVGDSSTIFEIRVVGWRCSRVDEQKSPTNRSYSSGLLECGGSLSWVARRPCAHLTLEVATVCWHMQTPPQHIPLTVVFIPTRIWWASDMDTHPQLVHFL